MAILIVSHFMLGSCKPCVTAVITDTQTVCGCVDWCKLENVAIAKALQLEAVPIRFNMSPVANLKLLSLSVAVLERIYC